MRPNTSKDLRQLPAISAVLQSLSKPEQQSIFSIHNIHFKPQASDIFLLRRSAATMKPIPLVSPVSALWSLPPCVRLMRVYPRIWYRTFDANFICRAPLPTAITPPKQLAPQSNLSLSQFSKPSQPPLSLLPFRVLIRSYLIAALSSPPRLLTPSLRLLSILANSKSSFLNPDRNPVLQYMLRKTIYAHFCAGENLRDVRKTLSGLKRIGYKGVILAHAKEIVLKGVETLTAKEKCDDLVAKSDVEAWKQSNLETLDMVEEGDFIAVKYGPCIVCTSSFENPLIKYTLQIYRSRVTGCTATCSRHATSQKD